MIAPRSRLLLLTAVMFLPALTLLLAIPSLGVFSAIVLLLFLLIVTFDAFLMPPKACPLRVIVPNVVRLSRGRPGRIEIRLVNEAASDLCVRLGIPFPFEIGATDNEF